MSKMSQLQAELTEQAAELGFESVEEAIAHGYKAIYYSATAGESAKAKLVEDKGIEAEDEEAEERRINDLLNEAHEDLIQERDELIEGIYDFLRRHNTGLGSDKYLLLAVAQFMREEIK